MYVPAHFAVPAERVRDALRRIRTADLVTPTADGLIATLLPMIWDEPGSLGDAGEHGSLMGHVAIKNDHWRAVPTGSSLAILRVGPDGYITPSWYAAKREHGRVVPTWDYLLIHAHGELVVHRDAAWLEANVRRLTDRFEAERADPWSVDDAPRAHIEGQLKAIVGLELRIERLEAKWKLSQNRSAEDVAGVIEGLEADGDVELADAVRGVERR